MKRVLAYAHDPGGINAISPVINELNNYFMVDVFCKRSLVGLFKNEGINCSILDDKLDSIEMLRKLLVNHDYVAVVTGTSSNDYTEKYLWKAAEIEGVFSIAIFDGWCNYGIRFSKWSVNTLDKYTIGEDICFLPTVICVADDYTKNKMVEEGIPEKSIIVTGSPHFDELLKKYDNISKVDLIRYKKKEFGKKKIILFGSDNISDEYKDSETELYFGYNEKTIFDEVDKCLSSREKSDFVLVIRPHPKEDATYWKERVKQIKKYMAIVDDQLPLCDSILLSDIVISMFSIILIEACIIHKPILSVQIGRNMIENPLVLEQMGLIDTIITEKGLKECLDQFFKGNIMPISWNYLKGSAKSILSIIEKRIKT